MEIISNNYQIQELLEIFDKPSLLKIDKSYYEDVNSIHCVLSFNQVNVSSIKELNEIDIDESLIKNSSKVLIFIRSNLDLLLSEVETITKYIYDKTDKLDYHTNLQIDFDCTLSKFDLIICFVE